MVKQIIQKTFILFLWEQYDTKYISIFRNKIFIKKIKR